MLSQLRFRSTPYDDALLRRRFFRQNRSVRHEYSYPSGLTSGATSTSYRSSSVVVRASLP